MERLFIETSWFTQRLKEMKEDLLLERIQDEILKNPTRGDVIQGTGGVRKIRVADKSRGKGKRGGIRVLYLDLPNLSRTYLLYFYSKNEAEDISPEGKKRIRELVRQIKGIET